MTVDFIVMSFDDVREAANAEVVCFAEEFLFFGQGDLIEGCFFHFGQPVAGVGEEEDEFDELGFVEGHKLLFTFSEYGLCWRTKVACAAQGLLFVLLS